MGHRREEGIQSARRVEGSHWECRSNHKKASSGPAPSRDWAAIDSNVLLYLDPGTDILRQGRFLDVLRCAGFKFYSNPSLLLGLLPSFQRPSLSSSSAYSPRGSSHFSRGRNFAICTEKGKKKIRYPCKARTSTGHIGEKEMAAGMRGVNLEAKGTPRPAHFRRGAWRTCVPLG